METVSSQKRIFQNVSRFQQNIVTKCVLSSILEAVEFLLFSHVENDDNGVSGFIQLKTVFLDD